MARLRQYSDLEDAIKTARVRGTHWCWIIYPNADPELIKVFHDGSVILDRQGGPYVLTWLEITTEHPVHGSSWLTERVGDWKIVVDLLTPLDDPCVLRPKGSGFEAFRIGEDRPYASVAQCGVAT
jgi:hypothetical protein